MRKAGLSRWPRNAMRHSYASYHISHFRDSAALALELGHTTTALIFQHYRQVVRAADAEKYWKIFPRENPGAEKLVTFLSDQAKEAAAKAGKGVATPMPDQLNSGI